MLRLPPMFALDSVCGVLQTVIRLSFLVPMVSSWAKVRHILDWIQLLENSVGLTSVCYRTASSGLPEYNCRTISTVS